jgi:hypothetical protein
VPEIIAGGPFEVDHTVAQAAAGEDEPENLASAANLVISGRAIKFPV